MDYTGFTSGIIFGQAISQYFSALNDSSQKQIMERLLGILWIADAYELSKSDTNNCTNLLTQEGNICVEISRSIEELKSTLKQYETKSVEFEENKKKKLSELKQQFKELKESNEDVLIVHKSKKEHLESGIDELNHQIDDLEKQSSVNNEEFGEAGKALAETDTSIDYQEKEIKKIDTKIVGVSKTQTGTTCSICGQKITDNSVNEYKVHLEADKLEPKGALEAMLKIRTEIVQRYDELKKEKDVFKSKKDELVLRRQKLTSDYKVAKKLFDDVKKENDAIRIENARVDEFNKSLEHQIKEFEKSKNGWDVMIDDHRTKIQIKEELLKVSETKRDDLRIEVLYHKFWEEGFSNRGLKSLIIESCIPQMNHDAKLYSRTLGGKYAITFSAQTQLKGGDIREKFNVEVTNKKGSENYDGNSNGERRAIDSIVMFVLGDLAARRSNKRFTLLILDDVFEKLDMDICDSINNVLKIMTIPKVDRDEEYKELPERESVFVLTHLEYFQSKFENQLWAVRSGEGDTKYRESTN
jgi:DNA repair exonuclease SbcCD ATPase subunit